MPEKLDHHAHAVAENDAAAVSRRCLLSLSLIPEPDAVHCPGRCYPTPAFGSTACPRSAISLKGNRVEIGRVSPLRGMTSAACGAG